MGVQGGHAPGGARNSVDPRGGGLFWGRQRPQEMVRGEGVPVIILREWTPSYPTVLFNGRGPCFCHPRACFGPVFDVFGPAIVEGAMFVSDPPFLFNNSGQ